MTEMPRVFQLEPSTRPLRLGFLGTGWIGRHRMQAILATGVAEAVAIADPSPDMAEEALVQAPAARRLEGLDQLLAEDLDGIVIATPSAGHAAQSIAALEKGIAVFCQKPLGRSAEEARAVVAAARAADRLLGVDFSYRETEGLKQIRALLADGALGHVFAADLTFHNAYGPDKPWFYDKALAGGGCVMDLGVHLADLALWLLGETEIVSVTSTLMKEGAPLKAGDVEDYAVATVTLASGTVVRLACSWRLQAGADAVIEASLYGTQGGASLRNVAGSFYDFTAERFHGTSRELLAAPPDDWGGRAAAAWARQLAERRTYDPACENLVTVSALLDRIYAGH
ncbi:Gfo/Idh/MocA family protein [Rhizobium sp. YIM 134829]|uniref:Gfo/Idh/MocA family protein n=1 Tax=Rhizobium sp. YIM 134829 TaxID=3390453 RepID=UPI00397CCA5C